MPGANVAFQAASTDTVGVIRAQESIRGRFVHKSLPDVHASLFTANTPPAGSRLPAHAVMDLL